MSPPPSPSGRAGPRPAVLLTLIGALAVLRLLAAAVIPLTEDEAYYRLWAQHPALGYYDHPPMIAWWIAAGVKIVGDTALGVRLLPALSGLVTTALVFVMGRRLGGARTGLSAALLYNATLTVGAGAVLAIPDVPASLFWTLALWLAMKATDGPEHNVPSVLRLLNGRRVPEPDRPAWDNRRWLAVGAAGGLACLSKYSALFLAPGLVLWLALVPGLRRKLLTPWPWLAALVAVAIFSLNVAWNAEHHWLTFAKQFGRVSPGRFAPRYLTEFLAAQFLLLNPAVAILAGIGALRAWRRRDHALVFLASGIPFLAYLLLHSLHDRVQAHWPVPLYPAAALLAAYAAADAQGWRAALARWAPAGIGLTAAALLFMALPQGHLGNSDPAAQLRGWPQFAARVETLRTTEGAGWVASESYGVNAQLQAQNRVRGPVVQLGERDRYRDMPGPAPDFARPGLVVDLERRIDREKLEACFAQVGPAEPITRGGQGGGADGRYVAVRVAGPRVDILKRGCDS